MRTIQKRGIIFLTIIFITTFFVGGSTQMVRDDEKDNFYLSNYTIFAPGDAVKINFYSYEKGSANLGLKLLKIDDPIAFFSLLDQRNSHYAFDIWGKDKELLLKHTRFIKEWDYKLNYPQNNYFNEEIKIGKINEPGIYIIQATRNDKVGYCAIVVTNYAMIYKNNQYEVLAFIANAKTGEFVKNTRFDFYQDGKSFGSKNSDKDGLLFVSLSDIKELESKPMLLFGFTGDEIVLSDPYFYFNQNQDDFITAYIYTQQPVYRPGQEVNFKAIFRNKKGNEILNVPDAKIEISVKSPKNKEVYTSSTETNEFGTISKGFILDEEADLGSYTIYLKKDDKMFYGSFSVEEYKKPEYKVNLTTERPQYSSGDEIKAIVSADYYFGSPVKNASVQIKIFRQTFWRPWWYYGEWSWFYRSFRSERYYGFGQQEMIYQESGDLNEDGKFEFSYKVDSDRDNDYQYIISAEVTDASRRAISGSSSVFITRGSFNISTSPDKWFYQTDNDVKIKVNASDFSDKPVQTDFRVIINYPYDSKRNKMELPSDTLFGKTNNAGSAVVIFKPKKDYTGYFNYQVIAYDEKEREIIASSSFYVGDAANYYYQRTSAGLEIITDKDSYVKGDSLIAYVFLPENNQELLLTYETDKILFYKKVKPRNNSFEIREKLTENFSPSFNISISYVKDRILQQTTKLIGVLAADKLLNITLTPSKETYKPGEHANYEIQVKDFHGNPVKNTEVSFGIIDESIYAIKEDETQPIETFFYSPQYYSIAAYNSLQTGYFNARSRPATYVDKNYFSYKDDNSKHKGKLYGKVTLEEEIVPNSLFVILTGEKNYYTTIVDTDGNYKIENVAKGKYEVYISIAIGGMLLIDEIYVDGEKKFNFTIDEKRKEKLEEIIGGGFYGIQAPDAVGNDIVMDESAPVNSELLVSQRKEKSGISDKGDYVQADIRTNFVDALIWKAHIVTDENGKAKVEFKIPDNLTTWRTTVRGITKQTDVGQKINKFISRKDLLVRMETPRFFRQDDEVVISTNVHNYLSSVKTTKIEFSADKLKLIGSRINSEGYENSSFTSKKVYEVKIPANSEIRIDWKVKVDDPAGDATLKASALTNEESDAMEVKVQIIPNGVKIIKPLAADYSKENIYEYLEFEIPQDVDLRSTNFSFTLNPSLAGTILKSLDDLAGYPYGCVEQTMSRFLPTIIVANTFKEIKAPLKSQTIEELPKYVSAGLKRLYDYQHSDGGWGWWENDQSHPYMTAYVIYGMILAREAGYDINDNVLSNGINSLKNQILNSNPDEDQTTLAYMIYSLSTELKNQNYDKKIYIEIIDILLRRNLKSYPLSLITIALNNMGETVKAKDAAERLKKQVNEETSFAFWGGEEWRYRWQDDNVQGTAFAVKALLNVDGNSALISKAVNWLMKKKQGYSWRSTQETSVVLFALTDYLKITKELYPDYSVKVYLNGKQVAAKNFENEDIYKDAQTFKFANTDLKKGKNFLRIEKKGKGKLYFSGLTQYFAVDLSDIKHDNGFTVRREYYVLETAEKDGHIIYNKKKFNGIVTSGQDVFVKTYVESKSDNLDYFILEDMLPSGFEIVKDMDKYFIDDEYNYQYYYYYDYMPGRWQYSDREYRDEKVAFFVTNCQKKMEFSYIIKAQIPGEYKIMPAQGYLMYYPELNGFSDIVNIIVEDVK